eukprot:COSAG04_NODE_1347_length_7134_cov_4.146695_5_plen_142_part_00
MASFMPPVPDSPVSGRTLATSNFKAAYIEASAPEGPMDLGMLLGKLLERYCQQEGIDWKGEGQPFLKQLQREAMRNMDDPIDEMMQRMCVHLIPPALLRTAVPGEIQMTLACETTTALPLPSDKTIQSHNGQHSHSVRAEA